MVVLEKRRAVQKRKTELGSSFDQLEEDNDDSSAPIASSLHSLKSYSIGRSRSSSGIMDDEGEPNQHVDHGAATKSKNQSWFSRFQN